MTDLLRVPVRCCCNAKRVLGTVEIERSMFFNGCRVVFLLDTFDFATLDRMTGDELTRSVDIVTLEVSEACDSQRTISSWREDVSRRELAVKSNDTPLDVLRRIPGFVEIDEEREIGTMPAKTV